MFNSYANNQEQLTKDLSEYAWKNKNKKPIEEFISEAYSEYATSLKPRELASKIGEIIENEYKNRFSN